VRTLTGWGGTSPSAARVVEPVDADEIDDALIRPDGPTPPGVIARGLGRSYGDAAQCAGGVVLDTRRLDRIGPIDPETGVVEVGAGVSLAELMRTGLASGWFVPVTPGTRQITVGGAIAADIHGKNHHADGSFGSHVRSVTLATPSGGYEVGPEADADLYWATVGGMGLTGVITGARVTMRPVETSWMVVDTEQHDNLDGLMGALERVDKDHRYTVAWLDCSARGRRFGRGLLDAGDHATSADLGGRRPGDPLAPPGESRLGLPPHLPGGLVNPLTVAAFNEFWFRKSPSRSGRLRRLGGFFHPLDAVANWNRLFGRRGFVQYQFAVGNEHGELVARALEALQVASTPCTMAVLKRFGPGDPGPLSFPIEGWTLALDVPVGPPALPAALRHLDELVAEAGGRVYLAKDSRLDRSTFATMYPRLADFEAVCRRVDPGGILQSDLSRRLGIRSDLAR